MKPGRGFGGTESDQKNFDSARSQVYDLRTLGVLEQGTGDRIGCIVNPRHHHVIGRALEPSRGSTGTKFGLSDELGDAVDL